MKFEKSFIPYGAYWSTPFCKWQGSLSTVNAVPLAAQAGQHYEYKATAEAAEELFKSTFKLQ